MKSETYIPCDILKPFIKSYSVQETETERIYKVLPDTGLVIGFQYRGKLSHLQDLNEIPLSTSGISGLADHPKTIKSSANIGTILIFFREAGASAFFRQPLHELFRQSVSLDNFILHSELLLLEEQLYEARADLARIEAIEFFLIKRLIQPKTDKLVLAALALIHESKGQIKITDLAKRLFISQSPLEKRFRYTVGTSPKKFASIVRFKNVMQQYSPGASLTELGHEAGFYDQAHFIKEFKNFTGTAPEQFFALDR